jgi:uncharacterized membrane protein
MSQVYLINKGVGRAIEFKGLKAQYIWYLGICIAALLVLFAAMYILGVNMYVCLVSIGILGLGLVMVVYNLSHKYGEHGLMKTLAGKAVPKNVRGMHKSILRKQLLK